MREYIGAIDQGTTSTRFIVFDRDGRYGRLRPEGAPAGWSMTPMRSGSAPSFNWMEN
jgi:sugar (pentulose or hexulose) kinase